MHANRWVHAEGQGWWTRRTEWAPSEAVQPQAFSLSCADGQRRGKGWVVQGLPS